MNVHPNIINLSRTTRADTLTIITWNARSLANKHEELKAFLYKHKIDITLVQETLLTPRTKAYIAINYKWIRKDVDPDTKTRGVCIYLKANIPYKVLPPTLTPNIEKIGIQIQINNTQSVNIYCVYSHPGQKFLFNEWDLLLNNHSNPTIVGGDLNARHGIWDKNRDNPRGKKLYEHSYSRNYNIVAPAKPTRIPDSRNCSPSTKDLFLIQNITQDPTTETINDLNSDHLPVMLTLPLTFQTTHKLHLNYDKANWARFGEILQNYNPTYANIPLSEEEIETEIKSLTTKIQHAIDKAILKVKHTINTYQITPRVQYLITQRNKARKIWQKYRSPEYKLALNKLSKRIQYQINILKNEFYENNIKKLDVRDNSLWKNLNKLKAKGLHIVSLKVDDKIITSDQDKVNEIGKVYYKIHKGNQEIEDPETESLVQNTVGNLTNHNTEPIDYASRGELRTIIICSLKNKKAPGEDKIQGIVIKNLPLNITNILLDIYNSCLHHNYFPQAWKNSNVVPIFKPNKDKQDPSSYRPISLLALFGKMLEKNHAKQN
ncbi:hypothetical protein M8J75_007284 [Diaphorina citri]|nr:hypothetical protein M8J75_007284 [Diaphorina citri]KAI5742107.1 hypothetical protein M8J77_003300 [Diaphorina citri]